MEAQREWLSPNNKTTQGTKFVKGFELGLKPWAISQERNGPSKKRLRWAEVNKGGNWKLNSKWRSRGQGSGRGADWGFWKPGGHGYWGGLLRVTLPLTWPVKMGRRKVSRPYTKRGKSLAEQWEHQDSLQETPNFWKWRSGQLREGFECPIREAVIKPHLKSRQCDLRQNIFRNCKTWLWPKG